MTALIDENTKVICQGFTGSQYHSAWMRAVSLGAIRNQNT